MRLVKSHFRFNRPRFVCFIEVFAEKKKCLRLFCFLSISHKCLWGPENIIELPQNSFSEAEALNIKVLMDLKTTDPPPTKENSKLVS